MVHDRAREMLIQQVLLLSDRMSGNGPLHDTPLTLDLTSLKTDRLC